MRTFVKLRDAIIDLQEIADVRIVDGGILITFLYGGEPLHLTVTDALPQKVLEDFWNDMATVLYGGEKAVNEEEEEEDNEGQLELELPEEEYFPSA